MTSRAKVAVSNADVVNRVVRDHPDQAQQIQKLGHHLNEETLRLFYTQSYKQIVNFDYWQMRCDFEQTDNAVAARADVRGRQSGPRRRRTTGRGVCTANRSPSGGWWSMNSPLCSRKKPSSATT